MYKYLYQQSDKKYAILYALDGYDEISLTSDFRLISNTEDSLKSPNDYHFSQLKQSQLYGGNSVEESAEIFTKILSGEGTEAQNNVVIANAATAIKVSTGKPLEDSISIAKESLQSGNALISLKKLISI